MLEVVPENFILRSSKSGGCQDDFSGLVSSFKLPHNIITNSEIGCYFLPLYHLANKYKKVQYTSRTAYRTFSANRQDLTFIA